MAATGCASGLSRVSGRCCQRLPRSSTGFPEPSRLRPASIVPVISRLSPLGSAPGLPPGCRCGTERGSRRAFASAVGAVLGDEGLIQAPSHAGPIGERELAIDEGGPVLDHLPEDRVSSG